MDDVEKMMRDGYFMYLENNGIELHKQTDTHMYLIVPKSFEDDMLKENENWRQTISEAVKQLFKLKLKIKIK